MNKKHKWVAWVAIVAMLLGMLMYISSLNEGDPELVPDVIEENREGP